MTTATATKPGAPVLACASGGAASIGAQSEDKAQACPGRLRVMVDRHYDFVWRSVRRLGVTAAHAEDAAQQVFWVASRKLERIEPSAERSFLFATAARVASDWRRSQARLAHRELSDDEWLEAAAGPDDPPDKLLEQKRARELLDQLLDELSEDLRTVLILAEGEQMTLTEMSQVLEVPRGTVASRLRRARAAFEALVQRNGPPSYGRGEGT